MLFVASAGMLILGLVLGWWFGSRPAASIQAGLDKAVVEVVKLRDDDVLHRLKLAEAEADLRNVRARADELAGIDAERDRLAARLAAVEAERAERDRAHAAAIARTQETFTALAGQALDAAQAKLALANEEALTRHREAAGAGLEANRAQLAELIQPMRDTLAKYEVSLGEVEKTRAEGYGQLTQLLDQVAKGQDRVSGETMKLATALRSSGKVAGRWGEEQCRNVLGMAGLVEGVDYTAQTSVDGEDGRLRPDFTISLPGGRKLVIDVKCSLDNYVAAAEAANDAERDDHLRAHARAVRTHATGLSAKGYEKSVGDAVDFVVLFVPGENFLAAAMEHDRKLMSDFMQQRLVLAGPINLIAVARTVAAMRDQSRLAEQAAEIAKLGRDLYDSIRIMGGNVASVQRSLEGAVTGWNKLVAQLDSRVVMRARRFEQLGATTGIDPVPELKAIETMPIGSTAPELLPSPSAIAAE